MQVQIISQGKALKQHLHDGETFVSAPVNAEYSIKLTNNSWKRRCALVSVDGVNILNGKPADFKGSSYVLEPWQTIDINGWHRTHKETAAFLFDKIKASYAAQTGHGTNNVGVIGVAVFDEKPKYEYWTNNSVPISASGGNWRGSTGGMVYSSTTGTGTKGMSTTLGEEADSLSFGDGEIVAAAAPAPAAEAESGSVNYGAKLDFNLGRELIYSEPRLRSRTKGLRKESGQVGTGYGGRKEMRTRETTFERATDAPAQVISLRYATKTALVKWGVIQEPDIPSPNPFPAEKVGVKPPPGWNG
jgi:hypothetical protein